MICIIEGHLGADPESRSVGDGEVCNFSVAENLRKREADGSWVDHTEWHRISVWGKRGQTCQEQLSKGSKVLVIGPLQVRGYNDRDGNEQTAYEVKADSVSFLAKWGKDREGGGGGGQRSSSGGGGGNKYGSAPPQQQQTPAPKGGGGWDDDDPEDDIPF